MACGLRVAQGYSSRLTSGSLVWLTAYGYGSRLTSSSRVTYRYGLRLTDTAYGSRIRLTAHEYGLRLTSGLRVARGYGSQLTSSLRVAHGYGSPRSSGSQLSVVSGNNVYLSNPYDAHTANTFSPRPPAAPLRLSCPRHR
ncbi:hypothetical protein BTJ68_09869 [Hortaea werneckii EXF-2000]|uniref:Uncharacterized protein n=1 Tax=Hortaea werneckii EXF-2000 TaxID=1157616 RepID=A0A1Z5T1P4_HORWE|nr:hypothetical protein BTJ68_09869 [Hortaea werneckii EXF-2000]